MNSRATKLAIGFGIALIAIYLGWQSFSLKSERSKETEEIVRLKSFGTQILAFKAGNKGQLPRSVSQLAAYIKEKQQLSQPNIYDVAFYHDFTTGRKVPWLLAVLPEQLAIRYPLIIAPEPYLARGEWRRIIMYSDGSIHVDREKECKSEINQCNWVQLR